MGLSQNAKLRHREEQSDVAIQTKNYNTLDCFVPRNDMGFKCIQNKELLHILQQLLLLILVYEVSACGVSV